MVSGVWAVESSPELQYNNHLTTKDMFDFIWTSTHYQTNAPLLRNVLPASGKGIDLMIEGGVPFMFAFEGADENTLMLNRGGHIYATSGAERAEALQGHARQVRRRFPLGCRGHQPAHRGRRCGGRAL